MDGLKFILIGSESQFESRAISEGRKKIFIESLPNCQTVTRLVTIRNEIHTNCSRLVLSKAPRTVLDSFLKELFKGIDLYGFMRIYSKLHIGEEFVLPVPNSIICMFYEFPSTDSKMLNYIIELHNRILTQHLNNGPLNLHDNTIATFTLVEANGVDFSQLSNGYVYSNDNFTFFIKSSNQFDLTVFYEEKKAGK